MRIAKCAEYEHTHGQRRAPDRAQALHPAHVGHLQIQDEQIGAETPHRIERALTVGRRADDIEVRLTREHAGESLEYDRMVVGYYDADDLRVTHQAESPHARTCRCLLCFPP